jgi:hypothetical protein
MPPAHLVLLAPLLAGRGDVYFRGFGHFRHRFNDHQLRADRSALGEAEAGILQLSAIFGERALDSTYGNPAGFPHTPQDPGSGEKAVPFGNAFDWLRSKDTRSERAYFLIGNRYRSTPS